MTWPSPQDYNEAIQSPAVCFSDDELRSGTLALNHLGLPIVASGAFASVYRMDCHPKSWAVRCFLQNAPDQAARYEAISECLSEHKLGFTVPFRHIDKGMLVHGTWYPMLKMRWVKGRTLDHVVEENLANGEALRVLADLFKTACGQLIDNGIAHGDLQHGNIMVTADGAIYLVDYDGMFVPRLNSLQSNELGHKNYQHPARDQQHFGPYLDNFSAWVIYTCLQALSVNPDYWHQLDGGDDCLLFKRADFEQPLRSLSFAMLETSSDAETATLARTLRYLLSLPVEQVPSLAAAPGLPADMPSMPPLEEIKETLAREAAQHQQQQHVQQQAYARAAAPPPQPHRHSTITSAPVKVHTSPVLIAEVTGEKTDYLTLTGGVNTDFDLAQAQQLPQAQQFPQAQQPVGSTALDLLLADRRAEDLQTSNNYGMMGEPMSYIVARLVIFAIAFIVFLLAEIFGHH